MVKISIIGKGYLGTAYKKIFEDAVVYDEYKVKNSNVEWDKWRLIWNGKKYKPKFSSQEEWLNHYQS